MADVVIIAWHNNRQAMDGNNEQILRQSKL